jgi:hypothetical protein
MQGNTAGIQPDRKTCWSHKIFSQAFWKPFYTLGTHHGGSGKCAWLDSLKSLWATLVSFVAGACSNIRLLLLARARVYVRGQNSSWNSIGTWGMSWQVIASFRSWRLHISCTLSISIHSYRHSTDHLREHFQETKAVRSQSISLPWCPSSRIEETRR